MSEQSGLQLSMRGMVIEKLAETKYRIFALQMTDCLLREGLRDLTTGTVKVIVVP